MTGPAATAHSRAFVAAAERIGARLVRDAVWTGDACTWRLTRPPDDSGPVAGLASGTLYEGTAGIALFLAELHRAAGGAGVAQTARGALRFALDAAAALPPTALGFYTGRVGIAYSAVRAGALLGVDLRVEAESVLRPLAGHEYEGAGLDVVSGAAGAIPGLLWLSGHLDAAFLVPMARRLADVLCAAANRHPHGWSWGSTPMAAGALTGYSHGASGMAHAFLELYQATGDGQYRHAAEQALLYERSVLSPEHGNWPDFRHRDLGEYFATGRLDELRDRLRAGWQPRGPGYVCFWCHGAAGIGLVRLRAHQVLGGQRYREEAWIAVRTTQASLDAPANYSLCHGAAGNCETLLAAAGVLRDDSFREAAIQCALRGIDRHGDGGEPWPCGTQGGEPDPGLLLGEAGIGLFLLRLADPEIESVLLVTPPDAARAGAPPPDSDAGYRLARERAIGEHFGRTLRRFAGLGVRMDALASPDGDDPAALSPVAMAYAAIVARIAAEPDAARRELLEDAFCPERARYDLLAMPLDTSADFMRRLVQPSAGEVDWDAGRFALGAGTRVVDLRYDWDGWDPAAGGPEPEPGTATHVLHRSGMRIAESELTPLAAAVLRALAEPASLGAVVASVSGALSGTPDSAEREWLRRQVAQQLQAAYQTGIVVAVSAPAGA